MRRVSTASDPSAIGIDKRRCRQLRKCVLRFCARDATAAGVHVIAVRDASARGAVGLGLR
jgi:hypothetical protein